MTSLLRLMVGMRAGLIDDPDGLLRLLSPTTAAEVDRYVAILGLDRQAPAERTTTRRTRDRPRKVANPT